MSYVLDALEKSQQERQIGEIPSAGTLGHASLPPSRHVGRMLLVAGTGLGLLVGVYVGTKDQASTRAGEERDRASLAVKESPPSLPMLPLNATILEPVQPVQPLQKQDTERTMRPVTPDVVSAAPPALALSRTLTPASPPPGGRSIESASDTSRWRAKVVGIADGCTIEVKREDGRLQKIRLAGVACLPSHSPAGKEARIFTTRALFVQDVVVDLLGTENGMLQADVQGRDGRLFNQQLVEQGLVQAVNERFRAQEAAARVAHRGLWQDPTTWMYAP